LLAFAMLCVASIGSSDVVSPFPQSRPHYLTLHHADHRPLVLSVLPDSLPKAILLSQSPRRPPLVLPLDRRVFPLRDRLDSPPQRCVPLILLLTSFNFWICANHATVPKMFHSGFFFLNSLLFYLEFQQRFLPLPNPDLLPRSLSQRTHYSAPANLPDHSFSLRPRLFSPFPSRVFS